MNATIRARAWLAERRDGVPSSLWERIVAELERSPESRTIPDVFRSCAHSLLGRLGTDHDDPLDVLTADALITYYCEALAELAPERLADVR